MAKINVYFMFVFVLMIMASAFCGTEEEHLCCPTGQYLVRKKPFFCCFEPKGNKTIPINPVCANSTSPLTKAEHNYSVNSYGQLVVNYGNLEAEFKSGRYCLGTLMNPRNRSRQMPAALVCNEEAKVLGEEPGAYCVTVSCLFLSVTAIIYIALPELRDIQGMSIINLCVSLALGFGIIAGMKFKVPYSDMTLCAVRGFLAYFFIIAAFFWMNVISIQILLKMRRPTISSYKWKEFIYYAVYAWGTPAILTAAVATVNFMPGDHIKPGIGLDSCWFFSDKQVWKYMYSVMTILIVVNICIFVYASVLLWKNTFNSRQYKIVRYKFVMTVRLAVVMGLSWIFEMMGSGASHIIWEILDIINLLQGVCILLVVVVLRRRAVQAMYRRGWLRCVAGPVERCLALGDNDEDEAEHATLGVPLESVKE